MAQQTRRNRSSSQQQQQPNRANGNRRQQQEYEEQEGWASAFHRPENEGNQPDFTGQGLNENGDPIEVAIWKRRAKSGRIYLRLHIQPPWEGGDSDDGLDDQPADQEQDADPLPF